MAQWDDLHPGRGSTAAANDAATRAGARHDSVSAIRDTIDSASSAMTDDVWSGDAGAAFRSSLTKPRQLSSELMQEFTEVKAALAAYAGEVGRIQGEVSAAHALYADGYGRWSSHRASQQPIVFLPSTFGSPNPSLREGLWVPGGQEPGLATMRLAASNLRDLATQRESADNDLVLALAPPASSRWTDMQAALAAAGITSLDDLSYASIADAFANIADDIAEGDVTEENVQALQDFYDVWGDDAFVMSNFYLELGGENTVALIDNLGDAVMTDNFDPTAALALATSIRGGLSAGSQLWSGSTSEDFADSMLEGASSTVGGLVSAIGFLFSDAENDPIGVDLTVAMADRIDRIEREYGRGIWVDSSPNAGGRTLAFLEGETTGLDGNRVDDLAGRVFSTLGEYPDAALDWLTSTDDDPYGDGELGADRVEYWYGDRTWSADSSGDGFEGPGALWSGAQQASGGPADAAHTYNPETWERVAALTTQVVTELTGNESFLPENLTSIGQVRIAEGISLSMPLFSENISESDPRTADDPFLMDLLIGTNDERAIPNVTQEQLAQLLGTATWSDGDTPSAGAAVIAQSVTQYQNALMTLADMAPPDSAFAADALERVVELQGWVDGSPAGAALGEAARHDEAVQEAIDAVSTVVGLIPIPAVGDVLVEGGSALIDLGQDIAIDQLIGLGEDQAAASWGNAHEVLLSQQSSDAAGREIAMIESIEQMLQDLGMVDGLTDAQITDRAEELMADYQRGVEANTSWAEGH